MKRLITFVITLVMVICTASSYAYANVHIDKEETIKIANDFLTLLEEKNYEKAKKMLVDERSIVNECGYTFEELMEENPLSAYYIYEAEVKEIDNNTLLLPTKVVYYNKDTYIIPIVVSNRDGIYTIHLIEENDKTDELYSTKTIYENYDEEITSINNSAKTVSTKVDDYEFWNLYTSVKGKDTFVVKAGSYKIAGEQSPYDWPGGSSVPCTVKYSIVKATGLTQTTYGSTKVKKSGVFTAYISGSKDFSKGRIVISRTADNAEPMRVRGSGTIYSVNS